MPPMQDNGECDVKRSVLSTISAAALGAALLASPLAAQGLDDATATGLARLGVQVPVESLSVEQQAEIKNIVSSSMADDMKKAQVELIIGNEATQTGNIGLEQLRSSVGSDLASAGIDATGVDMLTVEQLLQLENIMAGGDSNDVKKLRAEEVIGGEATATGRLGVAQLQDSVASDLARLGIDTEGVEMLTLSQLGQIENVVGSSVPDDQKKAQITTIMSQ